MTDTKADRLDEIRERLRLVNLSGLVFIKRNLPPDDPQEQAMADFQNFQAHAPSDISWLIAEVIRWRTNHKGVVASKKVAQAKTEEYRLRTKELEAEVERLRDKLIDASERAESLAIGRAHR